MTKPAITRPARQSHYTASMVKFDFDIVMEDGRTYNFILMWDLEAKDFLVQQTTEQAALENLTLSDLEKRMMYFSETGQMRENAIELNDAFEAEYDAEQYETKISKLMHHAQVRIKKENPEAARRWNEAIGTLSKGDHYLSVLWELEPSQNLEPSQIPFSLSFWKLLAVAILVLIILMVGFVAYLHHGDSKPSHARAAHLTPINLSNSSSLKTVTPNSFAFSYFEPGSVPTTT
jgi:hypothetical protein